MSPIKYEKSRSARAGLTFSVDRIAKKLKDGKYTDRVGYGAPVYIAAILEYLTREVLELAGNAAIDNHRRRISPRHIELSVRSDTELSKLLGHVIFSSSGGGTSSAQLKPLRKKAASSGMKEAASSGTKEAGSSGTKEAASSGAKEAASSGTKETSPPGTPKTASSGKMKASSPGTPKAASSGKMKASSPGTPKAASSGTTKVASWGAKKPASSRPKKEDKK
ncbi:histone H2A-III-like [Dendrobium catenatum]|uniref:Histone H2A n=1 Tax=Dendrobium catenatum TaxID=906689 RepID=A0A2I0WMN3_9ASPA|nr:histone H2A-III-like [Dendrobium catenatum]PKU76911.1 Histone H2A [Dendrobium catenatum]